MDILLPVQTSDQVIAARRAVSDLARDIGFSSIDRTVISVVVSELARNIIQHGGGGDIVVRRLRDGGITIIARDKGQGLRQRSGEFQQGHGLWAVERGVDRLTIEAGVDGRGTHISATKYAHAALSPTPTSCSQASSRMRLRSGYAA